MQNKSLKIWEYILKKRLLKVDSASLMGRVEWEEQKELTRKGKNMFWNHSLPNGTLYI